MILVDTSAWVEFDRATGSPVDEIYLRCRRSGVTPRGVVDCLIAAVAPRTGVRLLAADTDLEHISSVIGITIAAPG